jgi:hypothetical protein
MKLKTLLFLFFLALLVACTKENALDCFKSNGSEKTETRSLQAFKRIRVFDKIDYTITQGNEYKIEITAGKNIIPSIKTSVKDSVLIINNKNKCNFVRGYKKQIKVKITLPHLQKLENFSVGTVYLDSNFNQDSIFVLSESAGDTYVDGNYYLITSSALGTGNVTVTGTCNTIYVFMSGPNFFKANNLTVLNYAFIESYSIAHAYIKAPENGTFECNIHNTGNIYYTGNPLNVTNYSKSTTKGKLIKN